MTSETIANLSSSETIANLSSSISNAIVAIAAIVAAVFAAKGVNAYRNELLVKDQYDLVLSCINHRYFPLPPLGILCYTLGQEVPPYAQASEGSRMHGGRQSGS